jgi:hypothetical protein
MGKWERRAVETRVRGLHRGPVHAGIRYEDRKHLLCRALSRLPASVNPDRGWTATSHPQSDGARAACTPVSEVALSDGTPGANSIL